MKKATKSTDAWMYLAIVDLNAELSDEECGEVLNELKEFLDDRRAAEESDLSVMIKNSEELFKFAFDEKNITPFTIARGVNYLCDKENTQSLASIAFTKLCLCEEQRGSAILSYKYLNVANQSKGGAVKDEYAYNLTIKRWSEYMHDDNLYKNKTEFYERVKDEVGVSERTIRSYIKSHELGGSDGIPFSEIEKVKWPGSFHKIETGRK